MKQCSPRHCTACRWCRCAGPTLHRGILAARLAEAEALPWPATGCHPGRAGSWFPPLHIGQICRDGAARPAGAQQGAVNVGVEAAELTHCIAHSPAAPREKQKYLYWPRIAFHTLRCRVTSRSAVGEITDIVKVLTACPLNPPHPAWPRYAPRLGLWRPACTTASPILYLPKPVACLDRNKPWDQGILYLPLAVLVAQSEHCLPVRLVSPQLSQAPATTLHPHESCDKRDADAMLPSALPSSSDVDNVDWAKLGCQWGLAVLSSWRTGPAQPLCGRLCLSTCGVFRAAAGRHVRTVCPRVPPRPHLPLRLLDS